MADPICIGGLYRFVDDLTGETIEVPVHADLAGAIKDLDAAMERRARRDRKRGDVPFSAIEGRTGKAFDVADPETVGRTPTGWVDGVKFRLLIGMNDRWDGPAAKGKPCRCCVGRTLSPLMYCVFCDRSGRDDLLKRPPTAARPRPEAAKFRPKVKARGKAKAKPARNSFDPGALRKVR